ncbi:MAG: transcriptional regulator [Thermoanaerobaculaceae bacterium]|nr:transcriptional regulator [Thermoanaerobaculaceae bacterium]
MGTSEQGTLARHGGFRVGGWLVQPELNRVCHGDRTVGLEPRLMDVLVFLADRAGQVVSKDQLIDGVWKTEFITEWAITRAIAKLRKALGDEVDAPRYIETISKRGYRLIADVQATETAPDERSAAVKPVVAPRVACDGGVPFVVGQWVRGVQFYGRQAQLAEILDGHRDCLWVLGTRVSGKTSLLRQLELVTETEPERKLLPVFWDLQGAAEPSDLDSYFSEALLESRSRLDAAGVDVGPLLGRELFLALGGLRRAVTEGGRTLLLLCDEAEELLALQRRAPALLRKLRRALQAREGIRTVLAASARLWALAAQSEDTSPFLHGFTPPVHLGPLTDVEARSLLCQSRLDAPARPCFDPDTVGRALDLCGGHPYLLALLGSRVLARGELAAAVAEVEADPTLQHLFAVDLSLLSAEEAAFLVAVAGQAEGADARPALPSGGAYQLEHLGLVRQVDGQHVIGNHFLGQWLRRLPS